MLPLEEILDFQGDLKRLSKENAHRLEQSILAHGFSAPVFVWVDPDGRSYALDGHQRCRVLRRMRDEDGYEIPPLPVDYIEAESEREARAKLLSITSQYGEFDLDVVEKWISELDAELAETLRLVDTEISFGAGPEDETSGDDELPDGAPAFTERGDILELGRHRIICGDATDGEDVKNLLLEVKPHLMITDPPYGVDYHPEWRAEAGVNKNRRKMGRVENDARVDWREAWKLFPGDVAYVWHAGIYAGIVSESLQSVGYEIRAQIIWAKDRFALSRGHYHWQHEPCWYAVRDNGHWVGDRSQTTLWRINARDDEGHGHSTQKPLECMRRPILNNSSPGQAVYDPFLGSGTTLIAAEKEGRACYGIEINPKYVDITVARYVQWCSENSHDITVKKNGEIIDAERLMCAVTD